ncbi:ANK [Aspergillus sclerotialis]|uniref:ANK n=1 Tax=Aspergillus sclerotialis TaxID=2070753 RepID=A0A3A2ZN68_9EURO|nr:ANK [Aspergillus sclerotialis]
MPLQFPTLDSPDPNDAPLQAFLRCCRQGNLAQVLQCLESRSLTNTSLAYGLKQATTADHVAVMRRLLETGAIIIGRTVEAAQSRDAYQALLDHGLEVNNPMPFAYVVARNDPPLLRWFLSLGADPNLGPPDTYSKGFVGGNDPPVPNSGGALETAAQQCDTIIIDILAEHGAEIKNCLALQYAMMRNDGYRLTMLDHLARRGFDINRFGYLPTLPHGGTALHVAGNMGLAEEARWLIDHGADPTVGVDQDVPPLYYASMRGNRVLSQMLMDETNKVLRARKTGSQGGVIG